MRCLVKRLNSHGSLIRRNSIALYCLVFVNIFQDVKTRKGCKHFCQFRDKIGSRYLRVVNGYLVFWKDTHDIEKNRHPPLYNCVIYQNKKVHDYMKSLLLVHMFNQLWCCGISSYISKTVKSIFAKLPPDSMRNLTIPSFPK